LAQNPAELSIPVYLLLSFFRKSSKNLPLAKSSVRTAVFRVFTKHISVRSLKKQLFDTKSLSNDLMTFLCSQIRPWSGTLVQHEHTTKSRNFTQNRPIHSGFKIVVSARTSSSIGFQFASRLFQNQQSPESRPRQFHGRSAPHHPVLLSEIIIVCRKTPPSFTQNRPRSAVSLHTAGSQTDDSSKWTRFAHEPALVRQHVRDNAGGGKDGAHAEARPDLVVEMRLPMDTDKCRSASGDLRWCARTP
jgi:hypothetical protein